MKRQTSGAKGCEQLSLKKVTLYTDIMRALRNTTLAVNGNIRSPPPQGKADQQSNKHSKKVCISSKAADE